MPLELVIAARRQAVDSSLGTHSLGGGPADTVHVPGLWPGALRIHRQATRVLVVPRGPAWLRGVHLRPGVPVLLSAGDEIHLTRRGGIRLVHRAEHAPVPLGTRSLLRQLLAGREPGSGIGVSRLVCVGGPDLGRSLLVPYGPLELGRAPGCALRLSDPAVARWQARLWVEEEEVWLEDLGSHGGTRVNGRRVHRMQALAPGDLVGAGRTLLHFVPPVRPLAQDPPPTAPAPATGRRPRLLLLAAMLGLAGMLGVAAIRLAGLDARLRSVAAPGPPAPPAVPPVGDGARRSW